MKFWNQVKIGLKTYIDSFNYVFRKGLWWFLIFPVIINILLFVGGNALISEGIEALKEYVLAFSKLDSAEFLGSQFLAKSIQFITGLLIRFLFFILFAYFGGYVVLIILSPILAYLSEKTEKIQTGKDYPFEYKQFVKDIVRGIVIAIRNSLIELGIVVGILIITFIPVIGWLTGILSPVILFFVSAYFYGFSYMDYAMERRRYNVKSSVKTMRKLKGLATANGSIFAISLLIPFCGASLSSFVAIFSSVAGTLALDEVLDKESMIHVEN